VASQNETMNFGSWIKTLESTIDQALDINADEKKKKEEEEKKRKEEKKKTIVKPTTPVKTVEPKPTVFFSTAEETNETDAQKSEILPEPVVASVVNVPITTVEKKEVAVELPSLEHDPESDYIRVDLIPVVEAKISSDSHPIVDLLRNKLLM
jgi:hypothetical protein